jgi:hypothetical protein
MRLKQTCTKCGKKFYCDNRCGIGKLTGFCICDKCSDSEYKKEKCEEKNDKV